MCAEARGCSLSVAPGHFCAETLVNYYRWSGLAWIDRCPSRPGDYGRLCSPFGVNGLAPERDEQNAETLISYRTCLPV